MWSQISHRVIGRPLFEGRKMTFCPQKCICSRSTTLSMGAVAINMVYGLRFMAYGLVQDEGVHSEEFRFRACMVYGVWCMVYGVWCMVYGVWCMVYGVWYMVYGL